MTSCTSSSKDNSRGSSAEFGPSRWRRALRWLFAIAAALLTVFVALEIVLRATDDFGRNGPPRIRLEMDHSDPRIGYHLGDPWGPREYFTTLHYNREGFRGREFDALAGRPRRVALLGDSYVLAAQLPDSSTMSSGAESLLPDTQILPLATAGAFLPDQRRVLRDRLPQLFGPAGRYPQIESVVVGVRLWGLLNAASRRDPSDLRRRIKAPFAAALDGLALRAITSPSHALSYLGSRSYAWLREDSRREQAPLDQARLAETAQWMRSEVVEPLVREAQEENLPLAFVYLPSIAEVDQSAPPLHATAKREILELLMSTGAVVVDATPYFESDPSRFFPYDRHPDARGHRAMARAVADAVEAVRRLRPQER